MGDCETFGSSKIFVGVYRCGDSPQRHVRPCQAGGVCCRHRGTAPAAVRVTGERVDTEPEVLRITALTRDDAPRACPGCGQGSAWTHSRYVRRVADGSGGRPSGGDRAVGAQALLRESGLPEGDVRRAGGRTDGALSAPDSLPAAAGWGGRGGVGGFGWRPPAPRAAPGIGRGDGSELPDAHPTARAATGGRDR